MNGVAMFLQQMQMPGKQGQQMGSLEAGEKNDLFHSLLASIVSGDMLNNEQQEQENEQKTEIPLSFPVNIIVSQISDEEKNQELIQVTDLETTDEASNTEEIPLDMELEKLPAAHQTFVPISQEVQAILMQLSIEPENIEKAAPRLLQLLQQWTKAADNHPDQKGVENALTSFKQGETKEHIIWKDLLQAFEKRQQLASKQQYSMNALVTTEDIGRWLGRAMREVPIQDRLAVQYVNSPVSLPISRMEQVVVNLNQGQSLQAQGQQLIDQFQTMMKSGNFMTAQSKGSQIILSLRPENLGEMMIRFTQLNGEMAVKILVTSQAAKEMLEANMHQLRNMFSPQQVVVEKQDAFLQQSQETEKNLKDDQWDEQPQQFSDSPEEEKEQPEDDFAAQFEALLMNEEV